MLVIVTYFGTNKVPNRVQNRIGHKQWSMAADLLTWPPSENFSHAQDCNSYFRDKFVPPKRAYVHICKQTADDNNVIRFKKKVQTKKTRQIKFHDFFFVKFNVLFTNFLGLKIVLKFHLFNLSSLASGLNIFEVNFRFLAKVNNRAQKVKQAFKALELLEKVYKSTCSQLFVIFGSNLNHYL